MTDDHSTGASVQKARSHFHRALTCVATWPSAERTLFVQTFLSRKSEPQIASEMGLSAHSFRVRQRTMLRRLMSAAASQSETITQV